MENIFDELDLFARRQMAYKLLTTYKTYGKQKTGYEDVSLKTLFNKLTYYRKKPLCIERGNQLKRILAEIQNRFLQKLGAPSVEVEQYLKFDHVVAFINSEIDVFGIKNKQIKINLLYSSYLTETTIFHECKHLSQQYDLHKIKNGLHVENNNKFIAFCMLFSHLFEEDTLPYCLIVEELDANLYAYKTRKNLVNIGYIKSSIDDEWLEKIKTYYVLNSFEYQKGEYNKNFNKILRHFKKTRQKFVKEITFVSDEIKREAMAISPNEYIKYAQKVLDDMYDDVVKFLKSQNIKQEIIFKPNGQLNYGKKSHEFLSNYYYKINNKLKKSKEDIQITKNA